MRHSVGSHELATVFTIPFFINLGLRTFDIGGEIKDLSALQTLLQLVGFTVVPLGVGMIVRATAPRFAETALEPIRKFVLYLMICVLVIAAVASYRTILDHFLSAGALVLTMNVLSMGMGYGLARIFKLPTKQVVTLTFEVGVHNLSLALAITFVMLQRADLAVAALLYSVVMPATALLFVRIAKRMIAAEDRQAAAA